jgi:hypothetical protein
MNVSSESDHQKAECMAMEWECMDARRIVREEKIIEMICENIELEEEDEITLKNYDEDAGSYEIYKNGEYFGRSEVVYDDEERMVKYIKEDEGIFHFVPHILMSNLKDPIRARFSVEKEDESDDEEEDDVPKVQEFNDVIEEDEKECPICLVDIENGCSYMRGCCGHRVCVACFENMENHNICRCPLCRQVWDEDEEEEEDDEEEEVEVEWEENDIQEMLEQQDDALLDIIDIEALASDAVNMDGLRHCVGADYDEYIWEDQRSGYRILVWEH